ncbi:MAG TPA: molybdopterin-dependent oxidoreductase, partial [Geobacteraceae bacterium]|nr:molybdopterin-dependent oxidoreductase [Geobacteraceae bacterium]
YFIDGEEGDRTAAAVSLLDSDNAASLADVRGADCVAVVDCDLLEEGPMLALAVRQAWRKGAPVFLVGEHSPLAQAETVSIEAVQLSFLEEVPLGIFDNPVVICGTRHNAPAVFESLARAGAKFACILPGPNAFGAALLAREHGGCSLAEAVATGKIKGVVAVEADIPAELLEGIPFVAALDWFPTALAGRADVFLPTAAWVEMDGTFINNEGRAQRFKKVMNPGLPVKGLDPALHPPRVFRGIPPGGDVRPAWRVIAAIAERFGGAKIDEPFTRMWEKLRDLDPEGEGMRVV